MAATRWRRADRLRAEHDERTGGGSARPSSPRATNVMLAVADTGTGMSEAVARSGVRTVLHHQGVGKGSGLRPPAWCMASRLKSGGGVTLDSRVGRGLRPSASTCRAPRPPPADWRRWSRSCTAARPMRRSSSSTTIRRCARSAVWTLQNLGFRTYEAPETAPPRSTSSSTRSGGFRLLLPPMSPCPGMNASKMVERAPPAPSRRYGSFFVHQGQTPPSIRAELLGRRHQLQKALCREPPRRAPCHAGARLRAEPAPLPCARGDGVARRLSPSYRRGDSWRQML